MPASTPGPLALVTGTTSGIGAALAARLLHQGWHVVGAARREASLVHASYEHVRVDLADTARAAGTLEPILVERIGSAPWTRVALVNNAADGGAPGPLEHSAADVLARTQSLNVATPAWLMGLFVRITPPMTPLRIVNVSSGAAVHPTPGIAGYCASKAALRMAGQVLAAELTSVLRNTPAPRDVAILSYEPGVVETPMQQHVRDTPAGRFPWVGLFLDFQARGVVVPPERPAAEIADFLLETPEAAFVERRLGS